MGVGDFFIGVRSRGKSYNYLLNFWIPHVIILFRLTLSFSISEELTLGRGSYVKCSLCVRRSSTEELQSCLALNQIRTRRYSIPSSMLTLLRAASKLLILPCFEFLFIQSVLGSCNTYAELCVNPSFWLHLCRHLQGSCWLLSLPQGTPLLRFRHRRWSPHSGLIFQCTLMAMYYSSSLSQWLSCLHFHFLRRGGRNGITLTPSTGSSSFLLGSHSDWLSVNLLRLICCSAASQLVPFLYDDHRANTSRIKSAQIAASFVQARAISVVAGVWRLSWKFWPLSIEKKSVFA